LLDEGAIGQLLRVEGACSNLFNSGTHWFDMVFFYNDDTPAEWVMGQLAVEENSQVFGIALETSGLSWIRWHNGVEGLLATGNAMIQGPRNLLRGSDGIIEIGGRERPPLRIWRKGATEWENFFDEDLANVVLEGGDTALSGLDLVDAIEEGREPMLSGRKALQATELIFATYESSRRRGRVLLPLEVDDSGLLTMLDTGQLNSGRS
jgi:UDP-N-acetylglucosamine 3-dehydrogenase